MVAQNEVRIATTEAIFRTVNERIAESSERVDSGSGEFVCECQDRSCTHRVEASLDEYEHVRGDRAATQSARPDGLGTNAPGTRSRYNRYSGYCRARNLSAISALARQSRASPISGTNAVGLVASAKPEKKSRPAA